MTSYVRQLKDALTISNSLPYELLRAEIKGKLGYDAFWDIQHEAFIQLFGAQNDKETFQSSGGDY